MSENLGVQIRVASGGTFVPNGILKMYLKRWVCSVLVMMHNVFCSFISVMELQCEVKLSLCLGQLSFLT